MAHKKAGGSIKNGRDSRGKRLGIKCYGGSKVYPGTILITQRGNKFHAGYNVGCAKNYTLYSKVIGKVYFNQKKRKKYINVLTI